MKIWIGWRWRDDCTLPAQSQYPGRMDVVRDGVMYFCRLLVSTSLKREKNVLIPIAS
jgi:hypothetical protein